MALSRFVYDDDCCFFHRALPVLVDDPMSTVMFFPYCSDDSSFSCGIRDNVTACGRTHSILITSLIFYGWVTRSSWLRQGAPRLGLVQKIPGSF
jgi:hypothetical protein